MPVRWEAETLIATEAAIRTYLVPRKRNYLNIEKEWGHIARGLANSSGRLMSEEEPLEQVLLIDLLTATSPSLYTLSENGVLTMTTSVQQRIPELRRLASVETVSMENHKEMKQQIVALFAKQQQTLVSTPPPKKLSANEILQGPTRITAHDNNNNNNTSNMTLVERVAARAQAKQEMQQEHIQSAAKNTDQNTLLLRVADALWAHARCVMLRQVLLSPRRKACCSPPPCVMTMKDVCSNLAHLGAGRKEMIQTLVQLQQRAPTWIVFSPKAITKQTSVWIHGTEDYQKLRATHLGGRPVPNATTGNVKLNKPAATQRMTESTTTTKTMLKKRKASPLDSITGELQKTSETLLKPTTLEFPPTTPPKHRRRLDDNSAVLSTPPSSRKEKENQSTPRRSQINLRPRDQLNTTQQHPSTPPTNKRKNAGLKRKASLPATSSSPSKKKIKNPLLRINHHLIHTDADYDGGEVLPIDGISSPRGLKRLFTQMNAGQRI